MNTDQTTNQGNCIFAKSYFNIWLQFFLNNLSGFIVIVMHSSSSCSPCTMRVVVDGGANLGEKCWFDFF
jgi:hypothetical protein